MRRAALVATMITASAAVTLTPVTASAAAPYKGANTAAVQDDFNGDGYRDLAVGAPHASNGGVEEAGSVVVLYGSASSLSATRRTVITQATTGIPGSPEDDDQFGGTVASADLDRDGYADLIVGAPRGRRRRLLARLGDGRVGRPERPPGRGEHLGADGLRRGQDVLPLRTVPGHRRHERRRGP
ncbi:integrin alpha [Streptomyces sp. MAI_2237]